MHSMINPVNDNFLDSLFQGNDGKMSFSKVLPQYLPSKKDEGAILKPAPSDISPWNNNANLLQKITVQSAPSLKKMGAGKLNSMTLIFDYLPKFS